MTQRYDTDIEERYIDALVALKELHDAVLADNPHYFNKDCDRALGLEGPFSRECYWCVVDALEAARRLFQEGE